MLEARVREFLDDITASHPDEVVIAVTHKGVIRAALATLGHARGWQYDCDYGEPVRLG
jgi:broad specificity phosphatase PhoE